jgi:hypothetical protein
MGTKLSSGAELAASGRLVIGVLNVDAVGTSPRPLARGGRLPTIKNRLDRVRNLRDSLRAVSVLLEPVGAGLSLSVDAELAKNETVNCPFDAMINGGSSVGSHLLLSLMKPNWLGFLQIHSGSRSRCM